MRILTPAIVLIAFAGSAEADGCSEFRLALANREAVHGLLKKHEAEGRKWGTRESKALVELTKEASERVAKAKGAVLGALWANALNDDSAAAEEIATMDSLIELDNAAQNALSASLNWPGLPQDNNPENLFAKFAGIINLIGEASDLAFRELCRGISESG